MFLKLTVFNNKKNDMNLWAKRAHFLVFQWTRLLHSFSFIASCRSTQFVLFISAWTTLLRLTLFFRQPCHCRQLTTLASLYRQKVEKLPACREGVRSHWFRIGPQAKHRTSTRGVIMSIGFFFFFSLALSRYCPTGENLVSNKCMLESWNTWLSLFIIHIPRLRISLKIWTDMKYQAKFYEIKLEKKSEGVEIHIFIIKILIGLVFFRHGPSQLCNKLPCTALSLLFFTIFFVIPLYHPSHCQKKLLFLFLACSFQLPAGLCNIMLFPTHKHFSIGGTGCLLLSSLLRLSLPFDQQFDATLSLICSPMVSLSYFLSFLSLAFCSLFFFFFFFFPYVCCYFISQRKGPRLALCYWPILFKHIHSINK